MSTIQPSPGARFESLLDRELTADGEIVVPTGSLLVGVMEEFLEGGRVKGRASLTVALLELRVDDATVTLSTHRITVEASGSKKKQAATAGFGAGIGAGLGGLFGGKAGAATGAGKGGVRGPDFSRKAGPDRAKKRLTVRLQETTVIQAFRRSLRLTPESLFT